MAKRLAWNTFRRKTPKTIRSRFNFPKAIACRPDPRMTEINNRLEVMTKGNIGIATVEVHTACVGYELDGSRGETWSNLYNEAIMNLVKRHPDSLRRHCHRAAAGSAARRTSIGARDSRSENVGRDHRFQCRRQILRQ